MGFEPMNEGFADPCLTRLGYVANKAISYQLSAVSNINIEKQDLS